MALTYLSGDDIGAKRKSGGKGTGAKKQTKRKTRTPKTKAEKKAGRKRVFKKVAKVAVAPARAAFLTVVSLNALKLATKMVRVWNQPNGKATLTKFWQGFGGNMDALKKAIIKGSKQTINADEVGAVAVTTAIATATPIIVALVPIIKSFKAAGSKEEAAEFNEGVNEGKKDLAESEDVPKSKVSMPKNKDAGIVVDKDGESQEDARETKKARAESDTGGTDSESEDGEKKKLTASGAGGAESESESDEVKAAKAKMASNWSPLGFFFMAIMYLMILQPTGAIFQFIGLYCLVGMVLIPVAITKNPLQKIARFISFTPIETIDKLINKIKTKWQNYLTTTKATTN